MTQLFFSHLNPLISLSSLLFSSSLFTFIPFPLEFQSFSFISFLRTLFLLLLLAPGLSGSGNSGGVPDMGGSIYSKTQVSDLLPYCISVFACSIIVVLKSHLRDLFLQMFLIRTRKCAHINSTLF